MNDDIRRRIGMLEAIRVVTEMMSEGIAIARDYLAMGKEAEATRQIDAVLAAQRKLMTALEEAKGGGHDLSAE